MINIRVDSVMFLNLVVGETETENESCLISENLQKKRKTSECSIVVT